MTTCPHTQLFGESNNSSIRGTTTGTHRHTSRHHGTAVTDTTGRQPFQTVSVRTQTVNEVSHVFLQIVTSQPRYEGPYPIQDCRDKAIKIQQDLLGFRRQAKTSIRHQGRPSCEQFIRTPIYRPGRNSLEKASPCLPLAVMTVFAIDHNTLGRFPDQDVINNRKVPTGTTITASPFRTFNIV